MTLQEFQMELITCDTREKRLHFLRKYIFHGLPHVFGTDELAYFEFRQLISEKFAVGFQEIFIVGSAKLGFSHIKETQFNYDSDIDVVIVNEKLFEDFYEQICDYQYQLDKFWEVPTEREQNTYNRFLRYLVKGWMRPDLLPISFQAKAIKDGWFDFFKSISYNNSFVGNYKINGGLFKNYRYLEKYHLNGIDQLFLKLTTKNG